MRLSVVIPVYNGGEDLRVCLHALDQSTRKPDEVIASREVQEVYMGIEA